MTAVVVRVERRVRGESGKGFKVTVQALGWGTGLGFEEKAAKSSTAHDIAGF